MAKVPFSERCGVASAARDEAIASVVEQARAQCIDTVRVSFTDQHGVLRGKSIMVEGLASAFSNGVAITSTLLLKDTSHKTVFPVWSDDAGFGAGRMTGAGDVVMLPDPDSFRIMPWSAKTGWLLCDLYYQDGEAVNFGSRQVLRSACERLQASGMAMTIGLEVEFHVLNASDHSHLTHGFQYLTEDRFDQLEEIFELLRNNAVGLGMPVRSLEAEFGPSQCEVTFEPASAMQHADNMVRFRAMAKQVLRREGYAATFMCRPMMEQSMANGWHLHQSVSATQSGENIFTPQDGEVLSPAGLHWVAGLLAHARESCLLGAPTVNGYKRYQPHQLAPDRIQWGLDNKGAMVRVLAAPGDAASRVENRIGESAANPHFHIAAQILCGLDGITRKLAAPKPVETPYESDAERLPGNLGEAISAFNDSRFYRDQLGDGFVDYLVTIKQAEWQRYLSTVSQWEQDEYFGMF